MISILEKLRKFFSYWYLRYLLVTELYLVEPWEKAVIHVTLISLFTLFWYFNKSVVLTGVAQFRNSSNLQIMT